LVAGIGSLLALGLAARATTVAGRAIGGMSVPVLVVTVYFTYSRGAWVALGVGLLVMLVFERRRTQLTAVLIALAPWTSFAVYRASTSPALTTRGADMPAMTVQGHRLVWQLVAVALVCGLAAAGLRALDARLVLPTTLHRWAAAAVVLALLGGTLAVTSRYGSPTTIVRNGWHSFANTTVADTPDLNGRLFHLGGSGSVAHWRVAWQQAQAHPWLGSGAGTFATYWEQHRPAPIRSRNAHDLYVETLAELGPVGLLLLAGALALPLAAAARSRRRPLASAALGVYVAFLLHAAVDWDWQIPSATVAFLFCGAMLLSSRRRRRRARQRAGRLTVLASALLLGAGGLYTIATRIPLQHLGPEAASGDWTAAAKSAQRASDLAPWSSEPWVTLGEAELGADRTGAALVAFRKAVAAEPEEWLPWHDLARASSGAEQAHALTRALALNPFNR
jgi:O-Antigen ligase